MNLVVYSSLTGNTKKVANAIARSLNLEAVCVKDIQNLDGYENIIFGFYVDKGLMDNEAKRVAKLIKNKKVGLFMTLGAEPDSQHAKDCFDKAKKFIEKNDNVITHEFFCQGAIDPKLIQTMREMAEKMGEKAVHPITPEREERWKKAATHPDDEDLKNAVNAFKSFL